MLRNLILRTVFWVLVSVFMLGCGRSNEAVTSDCISVFEQRDIDIKPYRVLIIIGDQWTDPMSYNIDPRRVKGQDFLDVVNMLKIWGVPFDILRLDEQRLQINRFLDGEAKPNYGCIVWMANPDALKGYSANYKTLKQVVYQYGISMITLFDYIKNQEIADLVGVEFKNVHPVSPDSSSNKFSFTGEHFISSGLQHVSLPDPRQTASVSIPSANGITSNDAEQDENKETINIVQCSAMDSSTVLGYFESTPQFVVRDINKNTKVIWIGGGKDWFRKYPVLREIFRKALVYSIGYGIFNDNFKNGFIFIMDDIGCSEHAWSLRWHYPTPAKDTLIKYLIEPLEQYGFMMVQNITPGYANPETKMIESPWTVEPFEDIFGNWQDYGSTKEGLDEGLRRGVFEIQAHRAWSHMNWDLDSPPGPWWGSAIDGEMAVTDWYNEVVDVRRGHMPVPSNDLLFIYKTGIDAIKKSFGVVPLSAEVRPASELKDGTPGGDDNGRIAAIAGLGVSRECYVGFDYTIEFGMMMPEQFTCHDLDLIAQTDYPADKSEEGWDSLLFMTSEQLIQSKIAGGRRINLHDNLDWIESRKDKKWMGFNETCAYLHAAVRIAENDCIEFSYDEHYCRYFEKSPSMWTLELSDYLLMELGENASVLIDGETVDVKPEAKQILEIPAGLGKHYIQFVL